MQEMIRSYDNVKPRAKGLWKTILENHGIRSEYLANKHGPCPGCGGKDRFRFDDLEGDGTWICSQGGSGEVAGGGFRLLEHAGIAPNPTASLQMVSEYLDMQGNKHDPFEIPPFLRRDKAMPKDSSAPRKIQYTYRDVSGAARLIVTRVDLPNGQKKFEQVLPNGQKPKDDPSFKYLPYALDQWHDKPGCIHIVEGEKCADALLELSLNATTNACGGGAWQSELNSWFKDRDVIVLPDNDEIGERHCRKVADELMNVAASIRVCRLSNLPPKGDVVDWLAGANSLKDLKIELDSAELLGDGLGWRLDNLLDQDIELPEPPHRNVPVGVTILAGAPKAGKSKFCEWIASEVSLAAPVLYMAIEYSLPMAQQRFRWMSEKHGNIRIHLQGEVPRMGEGGEEWLDRQLKALGPRLVVVDTIAHFKRLAAKDGYEGEIEAINAMKTIFDRYQTSALLVHHTRKTSAHDDPNNPFERILGSTALTAVPDNIIVLESDGGRSILHTRGRLITQQKDIFELHGNEFAICQNAGAELAGIADVQSKILDYLGTDGPATQTQIALELGLQKSNVSRYVKRLAAIGRVQGGGRNKPVELVGDHTMI